MMNVLSRLTRQSIKMNRTRSIAAFSGILLAAAMFTVLTTVVFSLWDYVRRGTEAETGDYFVSCEYAEESQVNAARQDPSVSRVYDLRITGFASLFEALGPTSVYPVAAADNDFFQNMSVPLKEGRLPENSSEILIPEEVWLIRLQKEWTAWEIGQTVTLDLFDLRSAEERAEENGSISRYVPETTWKREYTIVGITRNKAYSAEKGSSGNFGYYCMLTLSDGAEGGILWHRLFLRTAPNDAVPVQKKNYGQMSYLNTDLLRLYGAGSLESGETGFLLLVLAALIIICVLSVVLIRSILSLSVTERTREFGLLASIGATPGQIRSAVCREALFFLGTALPLGLAAGLLGSGLLLTHYREALTRQFTFGDSVSLSVRISPLALLAAVLISAGTVLLSAARPAVRASRIVPLEAIRQNRDIQASRKAGKTHSLFLRLMKIPEWVGTRYVEVNRKKSRAVTVALALSLILFLPAVYLAGLTEKQADVIRQGFDFELASVNGRIGPEVAEKLRSEPEVAASVLYDSEIFYAVFPVSELQEAYKEYNSERYLSPKDYSSAYSVEEVHVYFIEDETLSKSLTAEGLDPAQVLGVDSLSAVLIPHHNTGPMTSDENGNWHQVFYEGYGISESISGLFLVQSGIPAELLSKGPSAMERGKYTATEDGRIALKSGDRMYLLEMNAEGNLGETECRFRVFDPVTGEAGEAAASTSAYFLNVRAELKLENAPDGCVRPSGISLVLPLSKALASDQVRLGIRIRELSDYYPLLAKLKALTKDNLLVYNDFRENDMNLLGLAALIRGISTGFLILVALFCAINVFYTLSTNLMLRRRDFGVLQSIGFTRRDLFRMAAVESTGSGFKALFIGLPVGIGLCYALFRMGNVGITSAVFHLPWEALLLGLSLIAVLMLAGIIYSLHFLRRQSPLEAIRQSENS